MSQLWTNDNGYTVCMEHAGNYLTAAVRAHPHATEHHTPLDTWIAIRSTGLTCEHCHPPQ